jgi:hypothetical protein
MKGRDNKMRNAVILGAACVLVPATLGLASCSLGLDESLIGQQGEGGAGADGNGPNETSVPEGGDGALPPIQPEAGICTKDEDCKGTAGCLTAKCDVPRKSCVFQVCRQPACNSAACDMAAMKCGVAKPYKFRATQFPVGAQIGCGGALARCFAAVYPYVFVGTANGVVAFAANDPQNPAPATVPISGLTFVPTQIVASGSRVYFLAPAVGAGPTSRFPLAYVDVPPDPFAKTIAVTTVLASHNRPATDPIGLAARGNDTALLVDFNAASAFASAPVEPPIVEPVSFSSTGFAFTAGAGPVAVSGNRLVMNQIAANGQVAFAFVSAAGSGTPMTGPDTPIPTAAPATGPQFFAQSADGAVFWAYVALNMPPGGMQPPAIRAAKGYFLVADGAAPFDPAAGIDLEVYPGAPPPGTPSVGPVAMLDAKTVMVTTSNPANPGMLTNVSFVTRGPPLAFVKNADMNPRRFPLTLPVSQLAAAGSNGIGYILAVDPMAPTAPTVHVFDPACAP